MGKKARLPEREIGTVASMIGDTIAANSHLATTETMAGMNLLLQKAAQIKNVSFDFAKGNYFEYIEATKFNTQAAMARSHVRAIVTDAAGDPHAAADILIKQDGVVIREVQAKFSDTAASSVAQQTGMPGHVGKYHGMDRLIRRQDDYKDGKSLLDESKRLAKSRAGSRSIYADEYKDVEEHLTDELHHGKVHSGGTTQEEVQDAHSNPEQYARKTQNQQFRADTLNTMKSMAITGAAMNALATGIQSFSLCFQDEKTLGEALKDTGLSAAKGAVRGGIVGFISTKIRHFGMKGGIKILSDSNAATILASGLLDCGSIVFAYARGQIDEREMAEGCLNTIGKGAATVYFTKLAQTALGVANPCIPMAIYTAFSFIVSSTKTIIANAKLEEAEYNRITEMLHHATAYQTAYHQQILAQMDDYDARIKSNFDKLLHSYNYVIEDGRNYDRALYSLVTFANSMGIVLQYATFEEFEDAMIHKKPFILE